MALAITLTYTFTNGETIDTTISADDIDTFRKHADCIKYGPYYCCESDTPCYCKVCVIEREYDAVCETLLALKDDDER